MLKQDLCNINYFYGLTYVCPLQRRPTAIQKGKYEVEHKMPHSTFHSHSQIKSFRDVNNAY